MKENRLIFKEGEPLGSLETKNESPKKNEPLSKDDEERLIKAEDTAREIKERSDEQRKLDEAEAEELFKLMNASEKVDQRLNTVMNNLFENKELSEGVANYIIENLSLISNQAQNDLAQALFTTGNMEKQNPKTFIKLVKSLENGIGKELTATIITNKIAIELKNLKNAGRAVTPDLLEALSDPSVQNLVSSEQWKLIWGKTKDEHKTYWKALALPNQDRLLAQN